MSRFASVPSRFDSTSISLMMRYFRLRIDGTLRDVQAGKAWLSRQKFSSSVIGLQEL